nr:heme exporter protein CcmB [Hankyongella ginsenosidimutans]
MARGGLLISLLVLPLAAPLVIFGVGALDAQAGGAAFKLLAATSLFLPQSALCRSRGLAPGA